MAVEQDRARLRAELAAMRQRHADRLWPDRDLRYRALFEMLAEGVVFHARDGSIQGCNHAAEEILGLTVDQMRGRSSTDPRWMAVREDGSPWPGVDHPAMETLQTGEPLRNRIMGVHKPGGTLTWISINTEPVFESDPERPSGVVSSFTDITELRQSQEALRQSERRLRLALTAAQMGIWEWDFATGRVFWAEETERIFGLEPGAFAGTFAAFEELVHPEDRERVERRILATVQDTEAEEPFSMDCRIITPKGKVRWTRTLGAVLRDESGIAVEMIGTVRDITREKDLEAQLRHSQRIESVGRLAGGVAHDFNNALSTILGSTSLLLREGLSSRARTLCNNIREAADQAANVSRRLLAFARKQPMHLEPIDAKELLDDIESLVRGTMPETIEVVVERPADGWRARVDVAQLEQVILNLALNAREAMPEGGRLRIAARNVSLDDVDVQDRPGFEAGDYVELLVEDTGHGMSPEALAHVFEPFFTTKPDGTGLGLAICHGIVRQLGGYIDCDSTPGRGTTFRLLLPRTTEPLPEVRGRACPPRGRAGETVLVAEDNQLVRETAVRLLREAGYTVLEASDGPEALEVASQHRGPIDVLLTDVVMPAMGGMELADRLTERRPETRVVLVSGHTDRVARLQQHGQRRYLPKPLRRDELLWTLRRVLDEALAPG